MSEPIQQPAPEPTVAALPVDDATEIQALRRANVELLTKRQKDKEKIAAMEIAAVALQDKAAQAETAAHDALIGIPLRRMAASVSDVPELFLAEFAKHYTIEAGKDGQIALKTLDGKPALNRNGKQVEFTPHSLYDLLASQAVVAGGTKDTRSKTFAVLMKYFGASGGNAGATSKSKDAPVRKLGTEFGLR